MHSCNNASLIAVIIAVIIAVSNHVMKLWLNRVIKQKSFAVLNFYG